MRGPYNLAMVKSEINAKRLDAEVYDCVVKLRTAGSGEEGGGSGGGGGGYGGGSGGGGGGGDATKTS